MEDRGGAVFYVRGSPFQELENKTGESMKRIMKSWSKYISFTYVFEDRFCSTIREPELRLQRCSNWKAPLSIYLVGGGP